MSIVLRADLRGRLPKPDRGQAPPPAIAKGILHVLDSFPPDRCYPSEETIARCSCSTVRTVRRALTGLIDAGLVETRTRNARGTRYASPRFYVIRYDILGALDYRTPALVAQESAPAYKAAPPAGNGQPRPYRPASPGHIGHQQQAREQQNLKDKQEPPGRRTADTVKAEVDLAGVVQELTPSLIKLGVARNRVTAIIVQAGSRKRVVEVLDLLAARNRRAPVRNPGGFIAQAIRQGWTGDQT